LDEFPDIDIWDLECNLHKNTNKRWDVVYFKNAGNAERERDIMELCNPLRL
jgi:hypothetical protein